MPHVLSSARALAVALALVPMVLAPACAAPEMAQRPNGQNARQYLQQRLPVGSTVTLDEKTTDRYGRLVAEVFKDINSNLVLVEDGITRPWDFRKGAATAARRSAPMPAPRNCCARDTPIWTATETGKPANRCAGEGVVDPSRLLSIPWRTIPDHRASSHEPALAMELVGNPARARKWPMVYHDSCDPYDDAVLASPSC